MDFRTTNLSDTKWYLWGPVFFILNFLSLLWLQESYLILCFIIFLHFSFPTYQIHMIIHYFIFNSTGYIKNQFNDQLPFGLLAQLVKVLHRCRRDQSSNSGKPEFFRHSFHSCISCIFNCKVLLCIYFFMPQFQHMKVIIYSLSSFQESHWWVVTL